MKRLFLTVFLLAAMGIAATAQRYEPITLISYIGTSTNVAGGSATNLAALASPPTIDCRKQTAVSVGLSSRNDGAGTANMGAYFRRSNDGVRWDTLAQLVTWAANGASDATIHTNIATHGCGWIRVDAVTNAAAATINTTNLTINYGWTSP